MQSERSTTELHPLLPSTPLVIYYYHCYNPYEVIIRFSQGWLHVFIFVFLIVRQTCFKSSSETGFRTQDLSHAKRTLNH